ncbi:MAG: DUF4249 domain-containing protein [Prevotella sp.]|nr:DUF4249 domain-containing protein [Prevotella sp.]
MSKKLLYALFFPLLLTACKKEIDFDYHEAEPIVVVEGRVTNEGTEVLLTRTRQVEDSVRGQGLSGAAVVVTDAAGTHHPLSFDPATATYRSPLVGTPGQTYTLSIDFEGRHYEGTSTMPQAAPIVSAQFLWQPVLQERLLVYEVWAHDPEPDERGYYYYRLDRRSPHPHFRGKPQRDAYRWNAFDDRGNPPGLVYRDVMCMSEKMAEEDEEDNWKRILYEGDTITFQLWTVDRPTCQYFQSLAAGQSGGANPVSNMQGGCLGYFTAASITRADTLIFSYDLVSDAPSSTIPKATRNNQ